MYLSQECAQTLSAQKKHSLGVRRRLALTVSNPGPIAAFLTAKFPAAFSRLFDSHNILRKGFLYRSLPVFDRRYLMQPFKLQLLASEMKIRPITQYNRFASYLTRGRNKELWAFVVGRVLALTRLIS